MSVFDKHKSSVWRHIRILQCSWFPITLLFWLKDTDSLYLSHPSIVASCFLIQHYLSPIINHQSPFINQPPLFPHISLHNSQQELTSNNRSDKWCTGLHNPLLHCDKLSGELLEIVQHRTASTWMFGFITTANAFWLLLILDTTAAVTQYWSEMQL